MGRVKLVTPGSTGTDSLTGLASGRYTIRAFPNEIVFDPPAIDLTESGDYEVRWNAN